MPLICQWQCINEQKQDWECCQLTLFPYQFSGIGLTVNGVSYTNNSIVTITEIGTGSAALFCITTLPRCCYSGTGGMNGWFLPNGREVMRDEELPYYRTRAHPTGRLLLHRNTGTTTGIFRCDIPDVSGEVRSLYVGIYTSTTGESLGLGFVHVSCMDRCNNILFCCVWYIDVQTYCNTSAYSEMNSTSTWLLPIHRSSMLIANKEEFFF